MSVNLKKAYKSMHIASDLLKKEAESGYFCEIYGFT